MKRLCQVVIFLSLCAKVFAQGGVYAGPTVVNGVGQPIANASVYVTVGNPCGTSPTYTFCNGQAQGIYTGPVPPSPLALIYTDISLGTTIANPIVTDPLGNWTVYSVPGVYWAVITGYQIVPTVQPIVVGNGQGGGGPVNCATALNGSLAAFLSPTSLGCDKNMGTDFAGNGFAQSWKYLGPVNGFFGVIGGAPDPGTVPAYKLNTNEVRALAPLTVPTPYYWRWPGTRCAVGQGWQMTGETTDANGDKVDTYGCASFSTTGGVQAQVNGTNFANCAGGPPCSSPLINFIDAVTTPAGLGLTWSNPSGGQIQPVLNDGTTRASNPVIPVATVNGTPGTTDYKYAVAFCQDINNVYCSALSPVVDVTTGAATITSTNSITLANYGDTLYGYRYAIVCRTASAGTPASTGIIATGAGKSFKDTGLTADGSNCATKFATNTSILSPLPCLSSFAPGGNSPYGAPCGIDAPPLSPDATNSENGNQFGAPGDANDPWWIRVNAGAATFSWTGGTLAISNAAGVDQLNCVFHAVASTPYGYVAQMATNNTVGGHIVSYLALRESATGKIIGIGVQIQSGGNSMNLDVAKWTSATVNSSFPVGSSAAWVAPNSVYLKVGDNATNIEFLWSPDGLVYTSAFTEARGTFFTTAPDQVGYCIEAISGTGNSEYDYLRKVAF